MNQSKFKLIHLQDSAWIASRYNRNAITISCLRVCLQLGHASTSSTLQLCRFSSVQYPRAKSRTFQGETDMNIAKTIRRSALGLAAMGLLSVGAWAQAPAAASSPAAPTAQQRDIRHDRRNIRQDRRDIRSDKRDRRADQRDINHDRRQLARSNARNGVNSRRSQALRHDIRSD